MSNPLAIGFGNIKILLSKLQKAQDVVSSEYTIDKVAKALDALGDTEECKIQLDKAIQLEKETVHQDKKWNSKQKELVEKLLSKY